MVKEAKLKKSLGRLGPNSKGGLKDHRGLGRSDQWMYSVNVRRESRIRRHVYLFQ